jgi:hypothetical protein
MLAPLPELSAPRRLAAGVLFFQFNVARAITMRARAGEAMSVLSGARLRAA